TVWVLVTILRLAGAMVVDYPTIGEAVTSSYGIAVVIGALIIGFVSTLSGGCPFRHHVLFGQGRIDSGAYLLGFAAGIVVYYLFIVHLLKPLL
ncbi:MAG TPA: YeeE/YedE thiosulfate transporter family protein, partial [Spirochaetia bacterium]